jgi:hypothetical protein
MLGTLLGREQTAERIKIKENELFVGCQEIY